MSETNSTELDVNLQHFNSSHLVTSTAVLGHIPQAFAGPDVATVLSKCS